MENSRQRVKRMSLLGMFLGVIFVLSTVESAIAPANMLNIRPGLSNIVVMYTLFYMSKKEALLLAVIKSSFVLIIRGAMAGLLSFTGGMLSIVIIIILQYLFKEKISYLLLSISGAIGHNLGQITAASLLLKNNYLFYYLPFLLIFSVATGALTGVLLKATLPYLERINIKGSRK